ncbi:3,4-dihydroxy-2-butanone-4-phosphate synthase [Pseudooceanicola sp.]|uniref:3,4-dihydroxy-2-butanone-4-phosphate synthase n=1 Tax=Pseudooceanicola sp. TaxID=1914328 RepID=UPI0026222189|nr:3,4-dihydroxy-2-butanone-4-phosphate synthase [Pseudooceanicola sp.]MDF1857039.1 3,4-dihydroxy-2-butanone-4-phosphate synthase [Pseudooceanicola sp.]
MQTEDHGLKAATRALAKGEIVILTDTPDAGPVMIMDAAKASPATINFMAKHGRGLIGLAISPGRAMQLGLVLQPLRNRQRIGPSYTYSIEARDGVSTGISAADRALTIRVAANPASQAYDLVSPGHIFPQIALPSMPGRARSCAELALSLQQAAGGGQAVAICSILTETGGDANHVHARLLAKETGLAWVAAEEAVALPDAVADN